MRKLTPLTWFVILVLIAIALALGLPPDPQAVHRLHTTATGYRVAIALLLIPYIFIWYVSFYAFAKLHEYSRQLKGSKDGAAFHIISAGMGLLAFSLVVPTIISLILNNIAMYHHGFRPADTIISNYLGLYPILIAFLLLCNGSRALVLMTRGWVQKLDLRWYAPWFLLLSVIFSHLTIENSYRNHPYHLDLVLLILTFILPYLYTWMLGLLSAYNLRLYAKKVHGTLYRRAIKLLAVGTTVVIVGSVAVEFVSITLTKRLSNSLDAIVLIEYGLLIIVAVGLLLMALGTNKLKKIEEV